MPLHFQVLARSLRALLLHRPLPRAPRQSPTPQRSRRPHSSSPRRRSPPLFRRSRKNPPHRQRRQHPPLEPLRPSPRIPSRIPRPASRPSQLRILRHPANPNSHPRPNSLTSSIGFSLCSFLSLAFVGAGLAPPSWVTPALAAPPDRCGPLPPPQHLPSQRSLNPLPLPHPNSHHSKHPPPR